MPDVVLTGLPRSGSTLTCHLLNRCADTVALHEPLNVSSVIKEHGLPALIDQIGRFFAITRESLLTNRTAMSKAVGGRVPDNPIGEKRGAEDNLRKSLVARAVVSFEGKDLSPHFTLAVKHNSAFAAMLEPLLERYPCRGIVRHPLAVISSWNSVNIPVQQGYIPVGQEINPALHRALGRIADRTERQLYILEWFFDRFASLLPREHILRYEDLIETGGRALAVVTPAANALDEPLASRNKNSAYDPAHVLDLGERLLGRQGAFWDFYTRESVEEMLAPLRQGALTP